MSRQNLHVLNRSAATSGLSERGGYILHDAPNGKPQILLIGTGSEVGLCLGASSGLSELDVSSRVISMPSWEIFREQPLEYQDPVMPKDIRQRVTVEAGSTFGWEKFAGLDEHMIGIDRFGASAPAAEIMGPFGFTVPHVTATALRLLGRLKEAEEEIVKPALDETAVAPTAGTEGHS